MPFLVTWLMGAFLLIKVTFDSDVRSMPPAEAERYLSAQGITSGVYIALAMLMWFAYVLILFVGPKRWREPSVRAQAIASAVAGLLSFASVQFFFYVLAPRMPYPVYSGLAIFAGLSAGTVVTSILVFGLVARLSRMEGR